MHNDTFQWMWDVIKANSFCCSIMPESILAILLISANFVPWYLVPLHFVHCSVPCLIPCFCVFVGAFKVVYSQRRTKRVSNNNRRLLKRTIEWNDNRITKKREDDKRIFCFYMTIRNLIFALSNLPISN